MKKSFIVFFLVFGLCFCGQAQAFASNKSLNELKQDKKTLQNNTKETKDKLASTREELNKIVSEIQNLTSQIDKTEQELIRVGQLLNRTNKDLFLSNSELKEASIIFDDYYESLKLRVKYFHENGEYGYLQLLFKSSDFSEFLNRSQYISDIMNYDEKIVDEIETLENVINTKTTEIESDKISIENLKIEQENKKIALENDKKKKDEALEKIEKDEALYEEQLKEFEEAGKEVEKLIKEAEAELARRNSSQSSGGSVQNPYTGGKLGWPVPGRYRISSGYVNRTNPISGRREQHQGLDIPAPYGTPIVAAEGGIVITSGWVGGYGNTIMINHGGGLVTLYGHNSSLKVSKGDYVQKGQTVALCGSTGMSTGNHCHFEVRLNGSHTNPNPYLN